MIRIKSGLLSLLLMATLLWSCQNEYEQPDISGTGTATVQLQLSTNGYEVINSRATSENSVSDVTVIQFKNGSYVTHTTVNNPSIGGAVNLTGFEEMAKADGNVVVCLANFAEKFSSVYAGLTTGFTYDQLIARTVSLTNAAAISGMTNIPMVGYYYDALVANTTNQMTVVLNRAMAKINFSLKTNNFLVGGSTAQIKINKIELHNVPTEFVFFPQGQATATYPAASGTWSLAAPDATNFVTLTPGYNQTTGSIDNSFVAYMPANARGTHDVITHYGEKHPATVPVAAQQAGWTYVLVDLDYAVSGSVSNAKYRIYIGGDDAADINLLGGYQYNIVADIYGANGTDARITVTAGANISALPQTTIAAAANSYIVNATFKTNDVVIPMDQARKGWAYITQSMNDGKDYLAELDALFATGNWYFDVLWKDWSTAATITVTPQTGAINTSGTAVPGYFGKLTKAQLDAISTNGNCIIALRSNGNFGGYPNGTIWWTWHLWFTDYEPQLAQWNIGMKGQKHTYISDAFKSGGIYNGKYMMDRHLGATGSVANYDAITVPTDAAAAIKWYGLMYQFGNKNPFISAKERSATNNIVTNAAEIYATSTTQINTAAYWNTNGGKQSSMTWDETLATDGFPKVNAGAVNRIMDATRMPYIYFHSGGGINNWTGVRDDNLWGNGDSKTAFDPCPPGWRVPKGGGTAINNPWAGFNGLGGSNATNIGNQTVATPAIFPMSNVNTTQGGRYYDDGSTKAWYPASGNRYSASGGLYSVGASGNSWAASVAGNNGYYLDFSSGNVHPQNSSNGAYGFPVRCLSE